MCPEKYAVIMMTGFNSCVSIFCYQIVQLEFLSLSVCECADCKCDYVAIYNGNSVSDPLIDKYCGNNIVTDITTGHQSHIVFKSGDSSGNNRGFK